jgi:hypothetical protein
MVFHFDARTFRMGLIVTYESRILTVGGDGFAVSRWEDVVEWLGVKRALVIIVATK